MKIAFVNDWSQHIALQIIAAFLKKNGHKVKVFIEPSLFSDIWVSVPSLHKILDFKKEVVLGLQDYNPDLIGFSSTTRTYDWCCNVAEYVKEHLDVPIIIGGLHPSFVPERVIENKSFDMLCVGEGEHALLELLNSMEKGSIDYSIKNLWFKKNGNIIKNEKRPILADVNSIPNPDMDIYLDSYSYYTNSYVVNTTRGCPYSCSYCCISYSQQLYKNEPKFRVRSVTNVIKELQEVKYLNKKTSKIMFNDTCFGYDINWLKEFSIEYAEKINIPFFAVMHPNNITEESIAYLKNAGCKSISLGMQTWDKSVRENIYNRELTNEIMENAVKLVKSAKMEILLDNIFDHPGSTVEKYIASMEFYTRCRPTRNYFYRLHYFPKTALSQNARKNNWITPEEYDAALDGKELRTLRFEPFVDAETKKNDRLFLQLQIFFIIVDLVPACVTNFIVKRKLYRYLPTFLSPAFLTIFRTLISFDFESRYFRSIMACRYLYFIKKKILNRFAQKI